MRPSVRARNLLTLVCATSGLALPATAAASGSSPVHIDPASPVAKEYALPLATARGAPPESGKSGSLFGSGIKHSTGGSMTVHTTSTAPSAQAPSTSQTPQTATTAPVVTSPAGSTQTAPSQTARTQTEPITLKHHPPGHITVTLPDLPTTTATAHGTERAAPAAYTILKPGSGSGLLWMVLAAVVVVLLGSAGGIALRRRR